MSIDTVNPATGKVIKTYTEMPESDVNKIIDAAHIAFQTWREFDFAKRSTCMNNIAKMLRQRKNEYATLIAEEMGKPLKQGQAEIEKCAFVCDHYAEKTAEYLKPRIIPTDMQKSYVTYQPLGIIFAIMPWNFPFWQVFRFAAPTLMAGNAALSQKKSKNIKWAIR